MVEFGYSYCQKTLHHVLKQVNIWTGMVLHRNNSFQPFGNRNIIKMFPCHKVQRFVSDDVTFGFLSIPIEFFNAHRSVSQAFV